MDPSAEIPQKDVCNIFIPSSAKTDQLDSWPLCHLIPSDSLSLPLSLFTVHVRCASKVNL